MNWKWTIAISVSLMVLFGAIYSMVGSGGFKRMVTMTGIYAVCRPAGYAVVCFADADSRDGGLFCLPLAQVGGECNR